MFHGSDEDYQITKPTPLLSVLMGPWSSSCYCCRGHVCLIIPSVCHRSPRGSAAVSMRNLHHLSADVLLCYRQPWNTLTEELSEVLMLLWSPHLMALWSWGSRPQTQSLIILTADTEQVLSQNTPGLFAGSVSSFGRNKMGPKQHPNPCRDHEIMDKRIFPLAADSFPLWKTG